MLIQGLKPPGKGYEPPAEDPEWFKELNNWKAPGWLKG